jgi:rhodanese-related sulfurtransferase
MRIKYSIFLMSFFMISVSELLAQSEVENFLRDFSYETRKEMKFSSEKITKLLENEEVILLDIRFREEQLAWSMDYALKIPLDELPDRLDELQKDKLIVTACPHKDRAIIAMMYLKSKGYKTGYLKDGLLGLADYLRGDNAKEFIEKLNAK